MEKVIECTVVYPVQFKLEINDENDIIEIRETIKSYADTLFDSSSIKSVILTCSDMKYQE